jgi:hypothetical protein
MARKTSQSPGIAQSPALPAGLLVKIHIESLGIHVAGTLDLH